MELLLLLETKMKQLQLKKHLEEKKIVLQFHQLKVK